VRVFAQTYLRCHPGHRARAARVEAVLADAEGPARRVYGRSRVAGALRRAVPTSAVRLAITRAELRRWGYQTKIYELTESEHKEVRNVAADALLKAGRARTRTRTRPSSPRSSTPIACSR